MEPRKYQGPFKALPQGEGLVGQVGPGRVFLHYYAISDRERGNHLEQIVFPEMFIGLGLHEPDTHRQLKRGLCSCWDSRSISLRSSDIVKTQLSGPQSWEETHTCGLP